MSDYILAIDQGTTGTTALVLDTRAQVLGRATVPVPQHFPAPGQVEHDGDELWTTVQQAIVGALTAAQVRGDAIGAIGITNQRETTLLWDRDGAAPCTAPSCGKTVAPPTVPGPRARGVEPLVYDRAGLLLDPYFSGTKLAWLLDHVDGARARAARGELAFGTIDTWLVHKLTGGAHVTDVSNASRTLLLDLERSRGTTSCWRPSTCRASVLPEVGASAGVVGAHAGVPGCPTACPSRASRAISRRPSSARGASPAAT
jgi:glycerol kinase